jgi:hypothetical protein
LAGKKDEIRKGGEEGKKGGRERKAEENGRREGRN